MQAGAGDKVEVGSEWRGPGCSSEWERAQAEGLQAQGMGVRGVQGLRHHHVIWCTFALCAAAGQLHDPREGGAPGSFHSELV